MMRDVDDKSSLELLKSDGKGQKESFDFPWVNLPLSRFNPSVLASVTGGTSLWVRRLQAQTCSEEYTEKKTTSKP